MRTFRFRRATVEFAVLRGSLRATMRTRGKPALASVEPPDLAALLAQWQEALRLRDWRVTVAYVKDLATQDGDPVYGLCRACVDNKTAEILIRDPSTPVEGDMDPISQIEETIIHELLHLHFAPFGTFTPAEIAAEEQAVWSIAEALVKKKGTGQEYKIARAMLANTVALAAKRRSAVRRKNVDEQELKQKALDAIENKDGDAALELLKTLLSGGGAGEDGATESAAEAGEQGEMQDRQAAADDAEAEDKGAKARRGGRGESSRSRITEADRHMATMRASAATMRAESIRLMVHNARSVDGIALPPAVERDIMSAPTIEEAKTRLRIVRAMRAGNGGGSDGGHGQGGESGSKGREGAATGQRARSGAEPPANDPARRAEADKGKSTVEQRFGKAISRAARARKDG